MLAADIKKELDSLADPKKAKLLQGFFKTGKGHYAEGDIFIGLTVPVQRTIAKKYAGLALVEIGSLLRSPIHEHRFTALEILTLKYERAADKDKKKIVSFYLKNRERVNNWDLVDASAPYILGDWLLDKERSTLYDLVRSERMWDRRIAIVSTFAFIREGELKDTLRLAEILLKDREDLMHKASGWMLREVGKKSESALERFLNKNCLKMPRTMLRYAIERFPEKKRKAYLLLRPRK